MKRIIQQFFAWYERHYILNVSIAVGLFLLQLVHLYWLSAHVIALRLVGKSFFEITGIWEFLILLVDYLEIPAIITTSLIYLNEYRKGHKMRSILYLFFINSQFLHIFWITDEFVVEELTGRGGGTVLPTWLAWVAIGIDYLELPVIFDTIKKLMTAVKERDVKGIQEALGKD